MNTVDNSNDTFESKETSTDETTTTSNLIVRPNQPRNNQITYLRNPGKVLVELGYDGSKGLYFIVKNGSGSIQHQKQYESYSPLEWVEGSARANSIRLPSKATGYASFDTLVQKCRDFIHRYFDCPEPFRSVATIFALHTWVYEKCNAVPYLRFLGLPNSGKSRGTLAVAALCYRSLIISGAATTAPLFRMNEAFGGTLVIDEADNRHTSIGADIAKILNCGYQKGLPVYRMEQTPDGEQVPRIYEVFGPKIINGRKRFADDATESRCLSFTPLETDRKDIPTQLPESFESEALEIRNMALNFRMWHLDSFEVNERSGDGLSNRNKQIMLPLLSLVEYITDSGERGCYRERLLSFAQQRQAENQSDGQGQVEAKLVQAYIDLRAAAGQKGQPTCKDLADTVKERELDNDPYLERWLSPRKAGSLLKEMGFKTVHTNRGSVVTIEPARLKGLAVRYALTMPEQSSLAA